MLQLLIDFITSKRNGWFFKNGRGGVQKKGRENFLANQTLTLRPGYKGSLLPFNPFPCVFFASSLLFFSFDRH
jgi:hypothetical protein